MNASEIQEHVDRIAGSVTSESIWDRDFRECAGALMVPTVDCLGPKHWPDTYLHDCANCAARMADAMAAERAKRAKGDGAL